MEKEELVGDCRKVYGRWCSQNTLQYSKTFMGGLFGDVRRGRL